MLNKWPLFTCTILITFLVGCATFEMYNNLSPTHKAFYNVLAEKNKNREELRKFLEFKTNKERDDYLNRLGYLQQFNELPEHVKEAIINHEIVKDAPEFTVYMAAGIPLKEYEQISMESGIKKTLYYLKCSDKAGANAGLFVPEAGVCVSTVGSALGGALVNSLVGSSMYKDPLHAEAISYVVQIKNEKVVSIKIIQELPKDTSNRSNLNVIDEY